MAYATIVPFDRSLAGAAVAGDCCRRYTEAELARQTQAAYQRGFDAARAEADQQVVDLRAEVGRLRDGIFARLMALEPEMLAQLRESLPGLAVDMARRLLAGLEPPAEMVSRICEEALAEIFPERENLELLVSPRDAALLEELKPNWLVAFPGLRITAEPTLKAGDCQVRSRFGLADARLETKVTALQDSLVHA